MGAATSNGIETLESPFFHNPENGYVIARVTTANEPGYLTIVGCLGELSPGEALTLTGTFANHPRYGRQFAVESFARAYPATENGVIRFLASSLQGVGPKMAEKLVATSMLDWTILRPPGVYGPGDTDVLEMFKMAAKGFCLLPPSGRGSWIHVGDLARLLVALLPVHEDATARTFEADDGEPGGWEHGRFARAIGWALGRRIVTIAAPRPLLFAAAWGDRLVRGSRARLTPDRASYMSHPDWVIDRAAAPPAALWQPQIGTLEGLKATARWYKAEGWL